MGHDPTGAVVSSRHFKEVFPWDFRREPDESALEELFRIADRIGGRPLLIPCSDDIVLQVSEHAHRLSQRFDFAHIPPELVRAMIDKKELFFLAKTNDIPTPDTAFPQSETDVLELARAMSFPLMVKGIDGLRLEARTGKKMVRVDDADELMQQYRLLEDPEQPNLMLQEFIPGGDDSVWMFNGYFDQSSECLMGFTGKKLHQCPPYRGATSLGVVLPNPTVRDLTLRFAKAIGYEGILDIGFRYDQRDGSYKLLDPNPRLGCTFRLFVGTDGLDVVRAQYLHVTGATVPASQQADGRKWMVEDWEIDSVRVYRQDASIDLDQWIADVRGVQEMAWFAWDDPLPFLKRVLDIARRGAGWARRKADARARTAGTPEPIPSS